MSKSIRELSEIIRTFSTERNWKDDDPNQLITSILIELGELAENFQWRNKFKKFSKEEKTAIGYEFVDIIFYLFQLANKAGIDIEKYFDEKLPKLEKKYPRKIGQGQKYTDTHKRHRLEGKSRLY
jgi:NTP pyrophosphatase (non-canonical NTP hydrolase)